MLNQRALIIGTVLFFLIVGGMFFYAYEKRTELAQTPTEQLPAPQPAPEADPVRINAVHFFKDGAHTIVGDIMMPTPCDLLEATATVSGAAPEQVSIAIHTVNHSQTCAQVLTLERFRVDFATSKDAHIEATLDGKKTILNLRDAEPGMKPETLKDLYFKG
jgi:hypothetical protein